MGRGMNEPTDDEGQPFADFRDTGGPAYAFTGIPSFLRAPIRTADLAGAVGGGRIAVLGVPADFGSPFMPGSRFGPGGIREHSLRFGSDGYYDARLGRTLLRDELASGEIVDVGDVDVLPNNVRMTFDRATAAVKNLVGAGALPVVVGGDHSISFPVVRAIERPLHVIHFDAHIDYSPYVHGYGPTNMTAFRSIRQMGHVQSLSQIGIRSIRNSQVNVEASAGDGNRVVGIAESRDLGIDDVLAGIPRDAAVYVSVDIDVLDMSLVPGCVSGEPDGFAYRELRDRLWAIAEHGNVVGFDLVEVNPLLDIPTGATSYLAAHTIVEFLGAITSQPRWKASPQQAP